MGITKEISDSDRDNSRNTFIIRGHAVDGLITLQPPRCLIGLRCMAFA